MNDVVVSSRIRLARNLADFPFLSSADESERTEVYRALADEIAATSGDHETAVVDVDRADDLDKNLLVERRLISRQHAAGEGCRGVAISRDETRSLMINEEDHLRIQGLRSGLRLQELWDDVSGIDDALSRSLKFSFDEQFGYLTACPTNVGTGIRVSVMVHLPGLKLSKEIERVARAAKDMRLAVRGAYGEGTEAVGDFYQISNQTTLGQSEEEIINSLAQVTIPKIVEYEQVARESLAKTRPFHLDDAIWRAYGILCNARRISADEAQSQLSCLRLGLHMGRFEKLTLAELNSLFLNTQPAHLQKILGTTLDRGDRRIARAKYLRQHLT
jgi:protein arginine kinase